VAKENPISKRAAKRRARKAARTRARKKAIRSAASRKAARTRHGRRGHRKSAHRRGHRKGHRKGRRTHHRKSPKRVRAGRKAARTRKARYGQLTKREREEHEKLKSLPGGEHGEESSRRRRRRRKNPIAAESRRKGHRKSPKRVAAGRKAARTRKRRHGHRTYRRKRPGHRRHVRRSHLRRVPGRRRKVRVKRHMSHEEARETHRRHRRRHHRRRNPISGAGEMVGAIFGVTFGYVLASGLDRLVSTHALTSAGASATTFTDTPPAGSIYNSETIDLPIWSSWQRMAAAAGAVGAPLIVASMVGNAGLKSFFQLAGFAALARTFGKAADDGMGVLAQSMVTSGNPSASLLVQLYAPEVAAQAALSNAATTPQAAAPAGTFAGVPALQSKKLTRVGDLVPVASFNPSGGGTCPPGYSLTTENGDLICSGNPPPAQPAAPVTPPAQPPMPPITPMTPPPQACPPPTTIQVPVPVPVPTPAQPPAPMAIPPTAGPTLPYNPLMVEPCTDDCNPL
jgi:hypothetical protein